MKVVFFQNYIVLYIQKKISHEHNVKDDPVYLYMCLIIVDNVNVLDKQQSTCNYS